MHLSLFMAHMALLSVFTLLQFLPQLINFLLMDVKEWNSYKCSGEVDWKDLSLLAKKNISTSSQARSRLLTGDISVQGKIFAPYKHNFFLSGQQLFNWHFIKSLSQETLPGKQDHILYLHVISQSKLFAKMSSCLDNFSPHEHALRTFILIQNYSKIGRCHKPSE